MRVFKTIAALGCYLNASRAHSSTMTVGLVPTMGGLHPGHLSLITRARVETEQVIVSIFVNPLQFGPKEDFQQYPRPLEQDLEKCQQAGVDVVFAPGVEELFTKEYSLNNSPLNTSDLKYQTTVVSPDFLTSKLCGQSRPGHFQGVTTIVAKLLNIVQPNRAYFGQKDAQQLAILQRMVSDLNWQIEIIPCPICREPSGLAYSSRNQYLTPQQKQQASILYQALSQAQDIFLQGKLTATHIKTAVLKTLETVPEVQLEYLELVDPVTLESLSQVEETGLLAIAAHIGQTRLIDNIILRNRQPIIAIDGPAGAGKSTVTRNIAKQLELLYLDTGAMYRAVTWLVLQSEIEIKDEPAIAELVDQCKIELIPEAGQLQVKINEHEVTDAIRTPEVTANVSAISAQNAVRQALVQQQRAYGRQGGLVAEGRDIGTNVFPDAELKIFLTASVEARAQRRLLEMQQKGQTEITLEQLQQDIALRDQKDSNRAIAPLQKAADAIEIQTDNLTITEVTEQIIQYYHQVCSPSKSD
ncbi:MAG: bifunctional pantoate--beta-alanine ligase/(d)CMP kinase [Microcoleaceae cyanobacterium]